MKRALLILLFFTLIFSACRFHRVEYYSNGILVKDHFRTTLTHSTSYTKWGKKNAFDSVSGKKISQTRYVKKVSCFSTHYKRLRMVEYDSSGKRKIVNHKQNLRSKNDTARANLSGLQTFDSLFISLNGTNLTEDISAVSSRNDELLLLVYEMTSDSSAIPQLILSDYFVFDSLNHEKNWPAPIHRSDKQAKLCFVLIEMDSDKNKEQLEPVVRLNLNAILQEQKNGTKSLSEKLLGDDDLIGLSLISVNEIKKGEKQTLVYSGNHLFDFYKYELKYWKSPE